jgi:hypothetical protein
MTNAANFMMALCGAKLNNSTLDLLVLILKIKSETSA